MLRSLFVGITLVMALFEVILRQFCFFPWEMDPEFGCIPQPGATVVYRREGDGRSRWTEHGVRRAAPLESGVQPILALGDSFTEAYMLNDDEVFTARAEALLAASHRPIPVLNLGKSGQSVADYVGDAGRNIRVFRPRWVVVQLRQEDVEEDAWVSEKVHFARVGDGKLEVVTPPNEKGQVTLRARLFWLRQRSALVNFTIIRIQEFQHGLGNEPPLFRAGEVSREPRVPETPDYPIDAELTAMMEAYGGRVTFLFLAAYDPANPDAASKGEAAFDSWCRGGVRSCVNLRQSYPWFAERYAAPYGFSNSGFNVGHMNAEGHAVASVLLAKELERLIDDGLL